MQTKKIKELEAATSAADTDLMIIEDTAKTRKITWAKLKELLGTNDSGWITATLTATFSIYSESQIPVYRKIGKQVHIEGAVCPKNTITGSGDNVLIFTLPTEFRPNKNLFFVQQGSGSRIWLLTVAPNGEVTFSKYRNGGVYDDVNNTNILAIQCTYFVN